MSTNVPVGERDPSLSMPNGACPFADSGNKSLVEQAEGLGRAVVMKDVVGPAFTEFLTPIYAPSITPEEAKNLSEVKKFGDVNIFFNNVRDLLIERLYSVKDQDTEHHTNIHKLKDSRGDLFYYADEYIFIDGIDSSVFVPLVLATQIHRMEEESELSNPSPSRLKTYALDPEILTKIMERESFDEMLMSLTKGPNGFLANFGSDHFVGDKFFGFETDGNGYAPLDFKKAFETEDGKVFGFSDRYHVTANRIRKKIREEQQQDQSGHRPADSSGRPVRHSFPDPETGEPQEPLVITAKKFLVAALKATTQKQSEQEAA